MDTDLEALFADLRERVERNPILAGFNLPAIARPSIRLVTQRVRYGRIGMGESRIGGSPDVVPGFQWPRWAPSKQRDDKFGQPWKPDSPTPLGFVAQIDLSAVPTLDEALPGSGWLYFFYDRYCEPWGFDPADRGCCRVIYENCDRSVLERTKPPADAGSEHIAQPCAVEAWPELTLPDDLPQIRYGTDAYEAYRRLCDELSAGGGPWIHRLLGYPQLIQNPMELECQLASNGVYCGNPEGYQSDHAKALEHGAADWRLLLQIDTDEEGPGWMWGDVGRIYFWLKRQDLGSLRFDDIWLIFQCC
jgi:uncharacterized protein YwqG